MYPDGRSRRTAVTLRNDKRCSAIPFAADPNILTWSLPLSSYLRSLVSVRHMDLLYRTMAAFIEQPLLAAVPVGIFLALFAVSRKFLVLAAAAAWLVYLPYEYAMKLRILCSGECNIRIDLLVLYPALFVISVAGLIAFLWALVRRHA